MTAFEKSLRAMDNEALRAGARDLLALLAEAGGVRQGRRASGEDGWRKRRGMAARVAALAASVVPQVGGGNAETETDVSDPAAEEAMREYGALQAPLFVGAADEEGRGDHKERKIWENRIGQEDQEVREVREDQGDQGDQGVWEDWEDWEDREDQGDQGVWEDREDREDQGDQGVWEDREDREDQGDQGVWEDRDDQRDQGDQGDWEDREEQKDRDDQEAGEDLEDRESREKPEDREVRKDRDDRALTLRTEDGEAVSGAEMRALERRLQSVSAQRRGILRPSGEGGESEAHTAAFRGPERCYEGAVGARGMEMRRISDFFRRDSRRYDTGFTKY